MEGARRRLRRPAPCRVSGNQEPSGQWPTQGQPYGNHAYLPCYYNHSYSSNYHLGHYSHFHPQQQFPYYPYGGDYVSYSSFYLPSYYLYFHRLVQPQQLVYYLPASFLLRRRHHRHQPAPLAVPSVGTEFRRGQLLLGLPEVGVGSRMGYLSLHGTVAGDRGLFGHPPQVPDGGSTITASAGPSSANTKTGDHEGPREEAPSVGHERSRRSCQPEELEKVEGGPSSDNQVNAGVQTDSEERSEAFHGNLIADGSSGSNPCIIDDVWGGGQTGERLNAPGQTAEPCTLENFVCHLAGEKRRSSYLMGEVQIVFRSKPTPKALVIPRSPCHWSCTGPRGSLSPAGQDTEATAGVIPQSDLQSSMPQTTKDTSPSSSQKFMWWICGLCGCIGNDSFERHENGKRHYTNLDEASKTGRNSFLLSIEGRIDEECSGNSSPDKSENAIRFPRSDAQSSMPQLTEVNSSSGFWRLGILWCGLCGTRCNDKEHLKRHINSKQHKDNLSMALKAKCNIFKLSMEVRVDEI